MCELPDAAVAEIAARMFDGDLSLQPQQVQDAVWRDARFALEAALKHITPRVEVTHHHYPIVLDGKRIDEALARRAQQGKS